LTDALAGAAESVAAKKGLRDLLKWSAIASAAGVFMLAGIFVFGYWLGMGTLCGWFAGIRALESWRSGAFGRLRSARLEIGIRGVLPQG
jgi:hypothetical protein